MRRRISPYVSRRYFSAVKYVIVLISFYFLLYIFGPVEQNRKYQRVGRAGIINDDDTDIGEDPIAKDPFLKYRGSPKVSWEDVNAYKADQERGGPGEHGKPVFLPNDSQIESEALLLYKANGYNAYISDMISLDRSIEDLRNPICKSMMYASQLPTVSVIIPFHDEHNSTLLRSVYSIINRSPKELLKEIILVDDFSEKPFLKKPLQDFIRSHGLDNLVKLLRTQKREGLIRARQLGAEKAVGDVLLFLDAHSEANYNWLPPLLDPIIENYRTVVVPLIDIIDCDTYEIRPQDEGARGSFDWFFDYMRLPLTKKDLENPIKPFPSPVMAGGYFAISSKWFWELGGYDNELDIWGGEQFEMSFKVWQCHGRMLEAPCSRVAHIYRCKYLQYQHPGMAEIVFRNYKRIAEVWMDEYKHHLYQHLPGMESLDTGDLSRQKAVRERLKCNSFEWFMKEVAFDQDTYYPAVEPKPSASGELRNKGTKMCVDTRSKYVYQQIGLSKCVSDNPNEIGNQNLRLSRWHDIRLEGRPFCFSSSSSNDKAPVVLYFCNSLKGTQLFKYWIDTQMIFHPVSGKCLTAEPDGSGFLYMQHCNPESPYQKWVWQVLDKDLLIQRQRNEPYEFVE